MSVYTEIDDYISDGYGHVVSDGYAYSYGGLLIAGYLDGNGLLYVDSQKKSYGSYGRTRYYCGAFGGCANLTNVTIPDSVTSIDDATFYGCTSLTSVTIPDSVTTIATNAFSGCTGLTNLTVPQCVCATNISCYFRDSYQTVTNIVISEGVGKIANDAFANCRKLQSVTIPDSVTRLGDRVFSDCNSLLDVNFLGDAPDIIGADIFAATRRSVAVNVPDGSIGWDGGLTTNVPSAWNGRSIAATLSANPEGNDGNAPGGNGDQHDGGTGPGIASVSLTVTNVLMHYVTQSIPSTAVVPPTTSGIVNVISEVNVGAAVAVTADWAAQYPDFETKFGNDFTKAITAETGKYDGAGKPMMVWQDFVAGTDPTNPDDVFKASITFDAATGEPIVSWTPELSATEAAKRNYRTYGKVRLTDPDWTEINGDAISYNFFKVTVEMR